MPEAQKDKTRISNAKRGKEALLKTLIEAFPSAIAAVLDNNNEKISLRQYKKRFIFIYFLEKCGIKKSGVRL